MEAAANNHEGPPTRWAFAARVNSMKELWIAAVEILTAPNEAGNTRAYTNVVAWARDGEEFERTVSTIFARRHWTVLGIARRDRVADCRAIVGDVAELVEQGRRQPGGCVFGTLFYYPSKPA